MDNQTIDSTLLERLSSLRERAREAVDADANPTTLRLLQALDRLHLEAARGAVSEDELSAELSELAEALISSGAEAGDDSVTASVVVDALPETRESTLLARNQARLLAHLVESKSAVSGGLDIVGEALAAYSATVGGSDLPDGLPTPAELQRRLSDAVESAALAARPELPQAEGDAEVSEAPRAPRSLRDELLGVMARMPANVAHAGAFDGEEMVLASSSGLSSTAREAGEASGGDAVEEPEHDVVEAFDAGAAVSVARDRLLRARRAAEAEHGDAQAFARALEGASEELARAEARHREALASLQQRVADGGERRRLEVAARNARTTARSLYLRDVRELAALGAQFVAFAQRSGVEGISGHASAVQEMASHLDDGVEGTSSMHDLARRLENELRKANGEVAGDAVAERTLSAIRARVAEVADHGARARAVSAQTLPQSVEPGPDEIEAPVQERRRFADIAQRFEQSAYRAAELEERTLAAETFLGREPRARRPAPRARLASPQPSRSGAHVSRVETETLRASIASQLAEIRGLSEGQPDRPVDLVSPRSGAEVASSASKALDQGSLASLASEVAARAGNRIQAAMARRAAARFARSRAGQIASTGSGRRELGFGTPAHFEYQAPASGAPAPLFKRKMGLRSGEGAGLLPILYKVAGFSASTQDKRRPVGTGAMLRKADPGADGADMTGSNLDLIQAIEGSFGPMGPRGTRLSAYGERNTQQEPYQKEVGNPLARAAASVSEWLANKNMSLSQVNSTRPQDQFETGSLRPETMVSSLNSEAMQLPTTAREKLTPFLGNIGDVKIYAGPIATMAAATFGAQGFTIGKHVFFANENLNFESTEGLALLAHELKHTDHFSQSTSVEQKEKEAEEIEDKVRKAYGGIGGGELALDKPAQGGGASGSGGASGPTPASKEVSKLATSEPVPPNKGGHRPGFDPDILVQAVYKIVSDRIIDEIRVNNERLGFGA